MDVHLTPPRSRGEQAAEIRATYECFAEGVADGHLTGIFRFHGRRTRRFPAEFFVAAATDVAAALLVLYEGTGMAELIAEAVALLTEAEAAGPSAEELVRIKSYLGCAHGLRFARYGDAADLSLAVRLCGQATASKTPWTIYHFALQAARAAEAEGNDDLRRTTVQAADMARSQAGADAGLAFLAGILAAELRVAAASPTTVELAEAQALAGRLMAADVKGRVPVHLQARAVLCWATAAARSPHTGQPELDLCRGSLVVLMAGGPVYGAATAARAAALYAELEGRAQPGETTEQADP